MNQADEAHEHERMIVKERDKRVKKEDSYGVLERLMDGWMREEMGKMKKRALAGLRRDGQFER